MEQETVDQIRRLAERDGSRGATGDFMSSLEKHFETGQRKSFLFWDDDEKLKAFTDMIGHTNVDTAQVIGFNYEATSERRSETLFDPGWTGECARSTARITG